MLFVKHPGRMLSRDFVPCHGPSCSVGPEIYLMATANGQRECLTTRQPDAHHRLLRSLLMGLAG